MKPRILLVEDESDLALTLKERLAGEGYAVKWADTLVAARRALGVGRYSLALLDVGLPDGSGFDLAQYLRQRHPLLPLVFLTSHGQLEERLRGLSLGAADYVLKPFDYRELSLRLGNTLRAQGAGAGEGPLRIGEVRIDWEARTLSRGKAPARRLSPMELAVLRLLWRKRGEAIPRKVLAAACGTAHASKARTVDNIISRLRRDFGDDPKDPSRIKSLRGLGYLMDPTEHEESP
ncbi:MAG: response regulator transcription factor [Spirochaetes bacterium]|nr:response regulator transcription factor [Spirochaetota bacterium]